MSLLGRLLGKPLAGIDWDGASPAGLVAYHATKPSNAIRTGARLVVREGWVALLVARDRVADVCPPGLYTLDAAGVAGLVGGAVGDSFTADVYYISSKPWRGVDWKAAVAGVAGQRANVFGTCGFCIDHPRRFYANLLRPDPAAHEYPASNLRNLIAAQFAEWARARRVTAAELAAGGSAVADAKQHVAKVLATMGVKLTEFAVSGAAPHAVAPPRPAPAADAEPELDLDSGFPAVAGPNSARLPLADVAPSAHLPTPTRLPPPSGRILLPPDADDDGPGFGGLAGPISGRMNGPPPAPMVAPAAPAFHAVVNGAAAGPFELATLAGMVRTGEFGPTAPVWRRGMASWVPAETVPELRGLFDGGPPPLETPT